MKLNIVVLLLYSSLVFSQINPLELKIDAISYTDSLATYRTFKVNYHLKNTTNQDITFINSYYPINTSYPDVKKPIALPVIYENGNARNEISLKSNVEFLQVDKISKAKTLAEDEKAYNAEYEKALAKKMEEHKARREERLKINDFDYVKSAVTTLKPNESKDFTEFYYWNKVRYFKINDLEYYIDENATFFLELSMNLPKEKFQYFFSEDEYKKMKDNPNFLEGIVRSNQVELNFKE